MRLNSIRQMGGPNSIDNFAKSFQRAAGFREITPARRGSQSIASEEGDEEVAGSAQGSPATSRSGKSLLRQQLEAQGPQHPVQQVIDEAPDEAQQAREDTSLLQTPDHRVTRLLSGSAVGSYQTSYGSISSRITESAQRRASVLIQQQHEANIRALQEPESDKYVQDRQVEREELPDGEIIQRIVGESTVPMTVFNSTNVLIGIGILALPLAFKFAGWVIGVIFLTFAALVTSYTAKLLAKCLDTNTASTTYGDIAFLAFDTWGRSATEILFVLELVAANVALIILFGDSLNSLVPAISVMEWKTIVAVVLIPLNFAPFKTLSITSVVGIFCTIGIIFIIFVDGLLKPHAPGSLREVAQTYAFPSNWKTIPLSFGLFMAPWGGHGVFPAIYKDMRHPQKYGTALKYTYLGTYSLDFSMAVVGYLMFGKGVRDEVTANILQSKKYPHILSIIIVVLISTIPITKIPLTNRPIMDTINKKFYIDLRQMDTNARQRSEKSWKHRSARTAIGVTANLTQLGIAIGFPDFDSIMALMGSALCFSICVILPISFHLKIFGTEISKPERILDWVLLCLCVVFGAVGTVWAIIPKEKFGIE